MAEERKAAPGRATAAEKAADPAYYSVHADDNPKDGPVAVVEEPDEAVVEEPVEGGTDEEPAAEEPSEE